MTQPSAREALLDAAIAEFAEHGFSGTRVEHVAERASFNKSLVYRYFGGKEGLFRAALARKFSEREVLLAGMPEDLAPALKHWFEGTKQDPHYQRLLLREALNFNDHEVVHQRERADYYRRLVLELKGMQERGHIAEDMDLEMLLLTFTALVLFPCTFPQLTQLITGLGPEEDAFTERFERFVDALAAGLERSRT